MKTIETKTKTNTIRGKVQDEVNVFKGIPYAKAPVGDLRWKEPVKLEKSDTLIDAFEFGSSGLQEIDEIEAASLHRQSEDCLTLNIWTRFEVGDKKPVMVFIHGGSYMSGGTADPLYDGMNFAKNNDLVFISINYRLSIFASLNFSFIGGTEYRHSGQLALLDQICALEWIKENVENFGGDVNNITIFGESCGGGSVSLLMTMPRAKGLFQKVIAQSGSYNLKKSSYLAELYARDFMKKTKCRSMKELKSLDLDCLRNLLIDYPNDYGHKYSIMFAPEADGEILPIDSLEMYESGCAKDVKLMVGTNANEFNYWKLYIDNIKKEMLNFLADQLFIQGMSLHYRDRVYKEYFDFKKDCDEGDIYISIADESLFRIPALNMADAQLKHNDTYVYYFKWQSRIPGMGACHALELPFVFNNMETRDIEDLTGENPPQKLADDMQAAWVSFAESGNPNNSSIPKWEKYNTNTRPTMVIDTQWECIEDPEKKSREIMSKMFY